MQLSQYLLLLLDYICYIIQLYSEAYYTFYG